MNIMKTFAKVLALGLLIAFLAAVMLAWFTDIFGLATVFFTLSAIVLLAGLAVVVMQRLSKKPKRRNNYQVSYRPYKTRPFYTQEELNKVTFNLTKYTKDNETSTNK